MEAYKQKIEKKYTGVSKIPERLLSFTIPIREKAIAFLELTNGSSVMDVGCGTGASFPHLEKVIGGSGWILGVEPSKSMIAVADERVKRAGWDNVTLSETTMEEIEDRGLYDGALLFAMHDVFNSMDGIRKIHSLLKTGARIVCVGPKLQEKGFLRILNPMLHQLFKRMAISQDNKDRPWRLVERVFVTERIVEEKHGLIFIYVGRRQ
ncbi:MAG: class I SAM-dependent methyltransferase [Chloroflexi bacterium]|nr:class I SAM-dependent methyltransferase [Chloroflexota bacterium]